MNQQAKARLRQLRKAQQRQLARARRTRAIKLAIARRELRSGSYIPDGPGLYWRKVARRIEDRRRWAAATRRGTAKRKALAATSRANEQRRKHERKLRKFGIYD